jgi:hypothetical protein
MLIKLKFWTGAMAMLLPLAVGSAFAMPASELHERCEIAGDEIDRDYDIGFCSGYFSAIAERQDGWCIPRSLYIEQVISRSIPLLRERPDHHAIDVIQDALRFLYPCG